MINEDPWTESSCPMYSYQLNFNFSVQDRFLCEKTEMYWSVLALLCICNVLSHWIKVYVLFWICPCIALQCSMKFEAASSATCASIKKNFPTQVSAHLMSLSGCHSVCPLGLLDVVCLATTWPKNKCTDSQHEQTASQNMQNLFLIYSTAGQILIL